MIKREVDWRSIGYAGVGQEEEYEFLDRVCGEYSSREHTSPIAIEIGTWQGRSTALLAQYFDPVVTIDPFTIVNFGIPPCPVGQSPVVETFKTNMRRLHIEDRVRHICNYSNALQKMEKLSAGVAFIDGDHSKEQCLKDAEMCLRHLVRGGLLVFHDWCRVQEDGSDPYWPGVAQGVDAFLEKHSEMEIINSRRGICVVGKQR